MLAYVYGKSLIETNYKMQVLTRPLKIHSNSLFFFTDPVFDLADFVPKSPLN